MKHPVLSQSVNRTREDRFIYFANKIVRQFQSDLAPLLSSYGLLDKTHVEKYLRCDSFKAIYDDIIADEEKERLLSLLAIQGVDARAKFMYKAWRYKDGGDRYIVEKTIDYRGRDACIISENTNIEWYDAWLPIPGADIVGTDRDGRPKREVILSFISYENGELKVDYSKIRAESYYQPSAAQCKIFDTVKNCIDIFKTYGIKDPCDIAGFFVWDYISKRTVPHIKGIMCHKKLMKKP